MRRFIGLDKKAFSIVELLVVFVVIGILVAIGTVVYSGVTNRANVANIQSDLDANASKLQLYYAAYGSYPTTLDANKCPSAPTVDSNYCLKLSPGNTVSAYTGAISTFILTISKGSIAYKITESTGPVAIDVPGAPTISSVTPGIGQITVAFNAGTDGGSTITNYEYSTNGGGNWTTRSPASSASPLVITGLADGVSFDVRIRAINANGSGTQSNQLSATTPSSPTIASPYSTYDLLFCRYTADCSSVTGISADFSYQVAFTAKASSKYSVKMYQIDNTSTSWTTGTDISASVTYATPTAGATISGTTITATNAGETRVTFTGTGPRDKTVFVKITEVDGANNALSPASNTKALGVYTTAGSYTLNSPASSSLSYMLVAGGASGGVGFLPAGTGFGGGGGAGGMLEGTFSATNSSYAIVVGSGGASVGGNANGNNGNNSTAFGSVAYGGGAGSAGAYSSCNSAGNGGSGGGAGGRLNCPGGTGTAGQGFDGGRSLNSSTAGQQAAGGGGGAGSAGSSGVTVGYGANGGSGKSSTISGKSLFYAGGGGGGGYSGPGYGGSGIGGNGENGAVSYMAVSGGVESTGSGGGGGFSGYSSGAGGTGIVIIRK